MRDLTEETLRRELVKFLVQKVMFCVRTGEVLDVDTCVVLNDRDGDPALVLSQKGWATLPEENRKVLAEQHGLTVDPATVKEV